MGDNHGIIGNVEATNVVVGDHARITSTTSPDIALGLEALMHAIAAHEGSPEIREALATAGDDLQEDLRRPTPDQARLRSRLTTISTLAGTASGVAAAAGDLLSLLQRVT